MSLWELLKMIAVAAILLIVGCKVWDGLNHQDDYRNELVMNCTQELSHDCFGCSCPSDGDFNFTKLVDYCADAKLFRSATQNAYETGGFSLFGWGVVIILALAILGFIGVGGPPALSGNK